MTRLISLNSGLVQSGFLSMRKDARMPQEIPRVLGGLCQESGVKTKNIYFIKPQLVKKKKKKEKKTSLMCWADRMRQKVV